MNYLIYEIRHNESDKIYIGAHKTHEIDDGYMGSGKCIMRAIEKHGEENFTKRIIHECISEEEMYILEYEIVDTEFINRTDTYNLVVGGRGGWTYINENCGNQGDRLNKSMSDDKRRLGGLEAQRCRVYDPAIGDKIKLGVTKYYETNDGWFKGKHHSEETKIKIGKANAISQKGEKNSNYGKFWVNDGTISQYLNHGEVIPEGFELGKVKKPKEPKKLVCRKCNNIFTQKFKENLCSDECKQYTMTDKKIKEYRKIIIESDPSKIGWITRAGKKIPLSRTAIRNFTDKYCDDIELYKRKER